MPKHNQVIYVVTLTVFGADAHLAKGQFLLEEPVVNKGNY
jgi:hypothetical protein